MKVGRQNFETGTVVVEIDGKKVVCPMGQDAHGIYFYAIRYSPLLQRSKARRNGTVI